MAHLGRDRVKETTTTTGTGNIALAGAATGFLAFSSVLANNDTTYYCIQHQSANEWEVGLGTWQTGGTLVRTTVIDSSNAGAAVNFSAGTKDVLITNPVIGMSWGALTVSPSTNQNDYQPTGLPYTSGLRFTHTGSIKLTGLAGGYEGRIITLHNDTTDFLLWLEHENTASTAANRFTLPDGFPAFLMPKDWITLIYDAVDQRWEVLAWPTRGHGMGLAFFTDCVEGLPTVISSGTGASGQGGNYLPNTTERPMGIWQIDTGTTGTGRAGLTSGGGHGGNILLGLGPALFVARLATEAAVSGTETFVILAGFHDVMNAGTWTDGVAWEYRWTGAAAEWSQTRLAAGAATRSNTGSPTPDTNYVWVIVFVNAGSTRADFIYSTDSVSFTKANSPTTGLPTSAQPTSAGVAIVKSAGTTQRNCAIDLFGSRVDYVRG